jgi:integrase
VITVRYLTPHSKWSIHSEYADNLHMLRLFRGGPVIWMSPADAAKIGAADNDWIEAYNRSGFPSQESAETALARLRMPSPGNPDGPPLTVGQWLERWLVSRTAPRSSTVRGYAAHVRLYLAPCLGQILLADLSPAHVQAMFTAIARQHEAINRPVTTATLVRVKATLRTALNAAIRAGHITTNAASRAELPTARRPKAVVWTAERVTEWQRTGIRPPVAVWTPAQTAAFLNAIRDHRLYAAYHLIALRGLRRGEACGLRWCDIDLDSGTAIICRQLLQYDGHVVLCPPKTAHSERIIALDRTIVAALRAHRARQLAERISVGEDYFDSGYVFTRPNGDPHGPGLAVALLPPAQRRQRPAAHPAARPAARRSQPRPGRRSRPESRPGHARALQHRAHR